jgi:hypothetical protein
MIKNPGTHINTNGYINTGIVGTDVDHVEYGF